MINYIFGLAFFFFFCLNIILLHYFALGFENSLHCEIFLFQITCIEKKKDIRFYLYTKLKIRCINKYSTLTENNNKYTTFTKV